jgi:hypothetical protein
LHASSYNKRLPTIQGLVHRFWDHFMCHDSIRWVFMVYRIGANDKI